MKAMKDSELV